MLSPDTVAREDLLLFLNAAFSCTGQGEFYSTADDQRVSVAFLHAYVLGNYRRLYARMLAAGINDFNTAEILFGLLSTGRETPLDFRAEENALLTTALRRLPPQRAWKLAERLRRARVNNRRTRALLRTYALSHRDLDFQAVKYRRRVRSAVRHAHLRLSGEVPEFLFGTHRHPFQTPLLETYRQARYSQEAVYRLPYSVAQGLAAKHGIAPATLLRRMEAQLTERERLRVQRRSGGQIEVRPERLGLTELAVYLLSLKDETQWQAQSTWLSTAARRVLGRSGDLELGDGRVAALLDNSYSSSGSREKRVRPLALALAVGALLEVACAGQGYRAFWTHPTLPGQQPRARGQTNLTERLLDALDWGAQTVLIISDGMENDPPGVFHAALVAAGRLRSGLRVLHVNPVFDAQALRVRDLSPLVPAIGLRNAEDLPTALGFAQYVIGRNSLRDLEAYLARRAAQWTGGTQDAAPHASP